MGVAEGEVQKPPTADPPFLALQLVFPLSPLSLSLHPYLPTSPSLCPSPLLPSPFHPSLPALFLLPGCAGQAREPVNCRFSTINSWFIRSCSYQQLLDNLNVCSWRRRRRWRSESGCGRGLWFGQQKSYSGRPRCVSLEATAPPNLSSFFEAPAPPPPPPPPASVAAEAAAAAPAASPLLTLY